MNQTFMLVVKQKCQTLAYPNLGHVGLLAAVLTAVLATTLHLEISAFLVTQDTTKFVNFKISLVLYTCIYLLFWFYGRDYKAPPLLSNVPL